MTFRDQVIAEIAQLNAKLAALKAYLAVEGEPTAKRTGGKTKDGTRQGRLLLEEKNPAVLEEARRRYLDGESLLTSSRHVGCSDGTLASMLQRNGVKLRTMSQAVRLAKQKSNGHAIRPPAEAVSPKAATRYCLHCNLIFMSTGEDDRVCQGCLKRAAGVL